MKTKTFNHVVKEAQENGFDIYKVHEPIPVISEIMLLLCTISLAIMGLFGGNDYIGAILGLGFAVLLYEGLVVIDRL